MLKKIEQQLTLLPDKPGIYFFYDAAGMLMYVGKATSLKSRVRSYFNGKRGARPIEQMVSRIDKIKVTETDSVLEAIIAEAHAIKQFLPKYNVDGKDNKSWNYIALTTDEYPRVETYRHRQMMLLSKAEQKKRFTAIFGPYPGINSKATLTLLRKLFHYSTCKPDAKRPCLYYQMGDCLGVCTGDISPAEYKKQVINPLTTFLKGGKKRVISTLKRRMAVASKEHRFEDAARMRDQVARLERIHDVTLINKSFFIDELPADNIRIEGYDISNLGATGKVGSMVVFDNHGPLKKEYRKFTIKGVAGQSDVDCLEEVLRRRLRHDEWELPSLFLIDGGLPQVNRAKQVMRDLGIGIPVVGIAKGPTRKKNEFTFAQKTKQLIEWVAQHEQLLVQVRDEAHRFAITFQRQKRKIK